ncbi:hypothetical protein LIER_05836 [Lithospermum erythrorhizon]|uniref:Polyprotein n=1 Tax=Lithospermum erythrorhizon TaxID=34254 RepID=A0AAV3P636_LITER
MEFISEYDCTIDNHPGKANVVADALSHKAKMDEKLRKIIEEVKSGSILDFVVRDDGALTRHGRIFVPYFEEFKRKILKEAHNAPYNMNLVSTKIYRDLRTV